LESSWPIAWLKMVSYKALRQFTIGGAHVQQGTELTRAELLEKEASPAFLTVHSFVEPIATEEPIRKDRFVVNETRKINGSVYHQ